MGNPVKNRRRQIDGIEFLFWNFVFHIIKMMAALNRKNIVSLVFRIKCMSILNKYILSYVYVKIFSLLYWTKIYSLIISVFAICFAFAIINRQYRVSKVSAKLAKKSLALKSAVVWIFSTQRVSISSIDIKFSALFEKKCTFRRQLRVMG